MSKEWRGRIEVQKWYTYSSGIDVFLVLSQRTKASVVISFEEPCILQR